jgi:hypothetical protein
VTPSQGAESRVLPLAVPTSEVPGTLRPARVCLDCGAPLTGKFCTVCGQKDEALKRGVKDLALEFLQHPLVDTKLWRSLVPLIFRPGGLTEEYLAGRRTRYVRPLKLYLTISVIFFAVLALNHSTDQWIQFSSDTPNGSAPVAKPPVKQLHIPILGGLYENFQRTTTALDDPKDIAIRGRVSRQVAGSFPKMVFVLLPLSAVLFKLFWWRRYFVEHLIFTLHLHSFGFLAGTVLTFRWKPVAVVVLVCSCLYLLLAFKRMYRQGWVKTLAKVFGVAFLYSIVFAAGLIFTALVALATA